MTATVRQRGALHALSAALVVIGCVVAIVPISPDYPAAVLDSAWMFALNEAVARHLAFGRDIVFTFGPYGSVYTHSFDPATDGLAMAASTLLAVAVAAGLLVLTRSRGRWLAVAVAILLSRLAPRDPLFFMTALLFLAVVAAPPSAARLSGRRLVAALALLLALALLPVIKGTFTAAVAVSIGLAALLLLVRGPRLALPGMALVWVAGLLACWRLAGQRPADLPAFFTSQGDIVRGYTEAMALGGPPWQLALFAILAAAVLAFNVASARRGGASGWIVLAGAAAMLALAYKASFIRQDGHIGIAAGVLGLTGCVLAIVNGGAGPLAGVAAGLLGWGVLGHAADGLGPRRGLARIEATWHDAGRDLVARLRGDGELRLRFENALGAIRATDPLPALAGPTDIYSTGQSVLLANRLDWAPRPVLQSYSAYTPSLEARDARHLSGAAAPRNVIVKIEPVDNRLPALEDGTSWPPILRRYAAVALLRDLAVFRLSPPDRPGATAPAPARSVHTLGEVVAVTPAQAPVWARVDVQPTALGLIAASVFRPPPVHIVIDLAGGRSRTFDFVPAMGRAGFLVAPLVGSAAQLVAMQIPGLDVFHDADVVSFAIEADARFWRRRFNVELAPLALPPRPAERRVLFASPRPVAVDGSTAARCSADMVDGRLFGAASPIALNGPIRLTGWGFVNDGSDREPDTMSVALESQDGTAVAVPATIEPRPDVGLYFHRPALSQVGFQALLDLGAMSGPRRVVLLMTRGARHWRCPLIDRAELTAEGQPAATCRSDGRPSAGRCS